MTSRALLLLTACTRWAHSPLNLQRWGAHCLPACWVTHRFPTIPLPATSIPEQVKIVNADNAVSLHKSDFHTITGVSIAVEKDRCLPACP